MRCAPFRNERARFTALVANAVVMLALAALLSAAGPGVAAASDGAANAAGTIDAPSYDSHAGASATSTNDFRSEDTALAAGAPRASGLGLQAEGDPIASGTIDSCVWVIDANGKLTISPAEGDRGSLDFFSPSYPGPGSFSTKGLRDNLPPWSPYASLITSAAIEGTVAVTGESCKMFVGCGRLEEVDLTGLDTSELDSFSYMFDSCVKLTSIDMSMLDASSIRYMDRMFDTCEKLAEVKLPDFSKSKIRSMLNMFNSCESLETIDLSTIDTTYLEKTREMFYKCTSLRKVIVGSKWDLSEKDWRDIWFNNPFTYCNALVGPCGTSYAQANNNSIRYARVDAPGSPGYFWLSENGNGSEGGGGSPDDGEENTVGGDAVAWGTLDACLWAVDKNGKLTISPARGAVGVLDVAHCDEFNRPLGSNNPGRMPWVPYTYQIKTVEVRETVVLKGDYCELFNGLSQITEADLSGLDTSQLRSFNWMFYGCSSLESIDASMLDGSSAMFARGMFSGCRRLTDVKLPDFSGAKIKDLGDMFLSCESLTAVDLSTVDTSALLLFDCIFSGCTALQKVVVGDGWNSQERLVEIRDRDYAHGEVFADCESLVGANGTSYAQMQVDDKMHATDATYARVDAADAPGYFWLAEPAGEGDGGEGGDGPGNGGSGEGGDGPGNGGNGEGGDPSGQGGSGDGPGNGEGGNTSGEGGSDGDGENGSGNEQSGDSSGSSGGSAGAGGKAGAKRPSAGARVPITRAEVKLKRQTFAYDGRAKRPAVLVTMGGKALKKGRDYTLAYSRGRKQIGSYSVTVTGRGSYTSKVRKRFSIVPKAPRLKSLRAHKNSDGSSGFIATWRKVGGGAVGYQVRWSTSRSFESAGAFSFAGSSAFASRAQVALQVRDRAWLGKRLFVEMRAYKARGGKKYYSRWSAAKPVTLKA